MASNAQRKAWLAANGGSAKQKEYYERWRDNGGAEKNRAWSAAKTKAAKAAVIREYGGRCVCCGESQPEFLTIDHIHGGGYRHRKEVAATGKTFYSWLRKNGYPKDRFRLLCMNCNFAKGKYGRCPHSEETETAVCR